MNNEQQRKYDERRLETLEEDYNHIKGVADALRNDIYDLTLEERVPDARERQLMTGRRYALESLQENIRETIVFLRKRIQANKPEPWEEDDATRTVNTPCGPVRLVNHDKVSKEELGEMIHHCGQDAGEHQPTGYTYKDLLGMEVMFVFPRCHKCEYCTFREGPNGSECPCVKVELVGGDCLCLAKRPEQKQTVISFDEEDEQEDTTPNIMEDIREKVDAFMDYLDSIVKPNGNDEQV